MIGQRPSDNPANHMYGPKCKLFTIFFHGNFTYRILFQEYKLTTYIYTSVFINLLSEIMKIQKQPKYP